ncbi:MAG: hypothetical protein JXR52_11455 [Bacteroidales bacterium]|nr:hypothetical protein [Bacteroidales bacterium]MBN2699430.1 hypothetical protein [Bacteroidales bacterium]
MDSKLIISGILVFLLLVSGMWLSLLGRPLNTIIFTFHKLLAVAAIVVLVLAVLKMMKGVDLHTVEVWFVVLSGIFLLLSFGSGALLSFESLVNNFTRMVHKLMPYLAVISMAVTILLLSRKT